MAKIKLIIAMSKLSEPAFRAKAGLIVDSLGDETATPATTNANFPEPIPAPYPQRADLRDHYADYVTKYDLADNGDSSAIAARNTARKLLEGDFKNIAGWLEAVCNAGGDPVAMAETTGFDLRRPSTHTSGPGQLPGPQELTLKHNGVGKIIAKAKAVKGAGAYETWTCIGENLAEGNWSEAANTKGCSRVELDGLTPGTLVNVRIRAIGPGGPGEWSNVENIRAL